MTPDGLFRKFHRPVFLKNDPLVLVHLFKGAANIETAGLVAAALAYGRVEQIEKSLKRIFRITGPSIARFADTRSFEDKRKAFAGFKHRFNDGDDVALLFEAIRVVRKRYGSIGNCFVAGYQREHPDVGAALDLFSSRFLEVAEEIQGGKKKSFEFFFPSPGSGSACKRLNLYLRWMVRKKDGVDFGLWKKVPASKLVIPVDTHVAACGRRLMFTRRNTADWRMAMEITENLRKYDADDPVKYDFAICSAGKLAFRGRKK
jgi:uncharacterized protein (TIGR02757 family)